MAALLPRPANGTVALHLGLRRRHVLAHRLTNSLPGAGAAHTWAPRTTAWCEDGAGLRGRGAASRHACAHAHVRTHAHALAPTHSLSPVAQTLHRNAANLLKEHGPFSHIRKASAVPPKVPKLNADGERPPNSKAPTERVLYTDDFGEEFEVSAVLSLSPRLPVFGGGRQRTMRTHHAHAMHMPCVCHALC